MSAVNPWKPETDIVLHQALGKLAEECSELAKIATRCMIQGYAEADPVTEKLNRTQLMEEVADVKAAMRWLFDVLDIPLKGESAREARKFDGFKEWQGMLEGAPSAHALLARLSKWDRDFPVNCWNGYAGLKELDRIIAEARTILGADKELPL